MKVLQLFVMVGIISIRFVCSAAWGDGSFKLVVEKNSNGVALQSALNKNSGEIIDAISYRQSLSAPIDAATGLSTRVVTTSPIVIVKRLDLATPLLTKAMIDQELLQLRLVFEYVSDNGKRTIPYFEVELADARIIAIDQSTALQGEYGLPGGAGVEEVKFVFENITLRSLEAGDEVTLPYVSASQ